MPDYSTLVCRNGGAERVEHRCGKRCPLHFPVTVLTGKGGPIQVMTRDISAGGMLVEGLPDELQAYEFVDIVLRIPGAAARIWRWPAMVVRSDGSCAALMFDRLRFAELKGLLRALRDAPAERQVRSFSLPLDSQSAGGASAPRQRYH